MQPNRERRVSNTQAKFMAFLAWGLAMTKNVADEIIICSECQLPVIEKDYAVRLLGKVIHLECLPNPEELQKRVREFEIKREN